MNNDKNIPLFLRVYVNYDDLRVKSKFWSKLIKNERKHTLIFTTFSDACLTDPHCFKIRSILLNKVQMSAALSVKIRCTLNAPV
jgi:hypothetical protein